MAEVSRADVVAWVAAVYRTPDAERRVAEGPAAFLVRLDGGRALLVRRRTGQYWEFGAVTDLYTARSDRRLRRALRSLMFDVDQAAGVIHDPSGDLTEPALMAWFDATYGGRENFGQVFDVGWAFIAVMGAVVYAPGIPQSVTLAVVKRTGEVWKLLPGYDLDRVYHARTEAQFRSGFPSGPIAQIPR